MQDQCHGVPAVETCNVLRECYTRQDGRVKLQSGGEPDTLTVQQSTVKCWKNRIIEARLRAGCFTSFGVDVSKGTNKNTKHRLYKSKGD